MKKVIDQKDLFIPLPVLVIGTYDELGNANVMTAAWGTLHDYGEVFICLSTNHLTTKNINKTKEFTVSFATKDTVAIADYYGIVSGEKESKVSISKVHEYKSTTINAPLFEEFLASLECKVKKIEDDGQTTYLVGEIINVVADEQVMSNGKIDFEKLQPIVFNASTNTYHVIGEKVADAFEIGKKVKNE